MSGIGLLVSAGIGLVNFGINTFLSIGSRGSVDFSQIVPKMTPRVPQISGTSQSLQSSLTYGFSGPINSLSDGLPIPDLGGMLRVGAQIINYYIEVSDKKETLYMLLAIASGPLSAVVYGETPEHIWINTTKKLSEAPHAEYQTRLGTYDQTAISWFNALHQLRTMDLSMAQETKLLLHFEESSFVDSSIFARTITNHSVTRSSAARMFGSYSGLFAAADTKVTHWLDLTDGTPDENGAFDLGNSDFTIEMWIRPSGMATNRNYCIYKWEEESIDGSGNTLHYFTGAGTGAGFYFVHVNGEVDPWALNFILFAPCMLSMNTWYHIALVRSGASYYFFLNGVDKASPEISSEWGKTVFRPSSPATKPCLGKSGANPYTITYDWRGYIDEFRLTNGKANYIQNFTPPSAAFVGYATNTITTRGSAVDKLSLIFTFPYGLYTQSSDTVTGEITLDKKSVEFDIRFSRFNWSGDYKWKGANQIVVGERQGLFRSQMSFEFNRLELTTITGNFSAGEIITGATSGATAMIALDQYSTVLYVVDQIGTFVIGEGINGGTSLAHGHITAVPYNDATSWSVQVSRVTDDDYRTSSVSSSTLDLVDEVNRTSLEYPNIALLGISVPYSDTVGSGMENVSVLANKGNVTIPQWAASGGGTQTMASSNPAYKFLDVMCNGLGVSIERINQASIVAWAAYCVAMIGSQFRASWNGIFDTLSTGEDAIDKLLKVGRASLIKSNEYKIVIDTVVPESSFTGLFTAANIVDGTYSFQWLRKSEKPHAVCVEYLDEDGEGERKSVSHYGPEYDKTTEPLRIDQDFLIGCTNEDETKRYAILRYQSKEKMTSACQFEASIDAINCEPGDCIWVQPLRSQKSYGGFVVSATSTGIVLDQEITLDADTFSGYASVWVRHSTGSIERRTINSMFDVKRNSFTVTPAWSVTPSEGAVYGIGRYQASINPIDIWRWRVMRLARGGDDGRVRLECAEYNAKTYYHADYGTTII